MAITIEDGSIIDNSNSYITAGELDAYVADMGYTAVTEHEPKLIQSFLLMGALPWCVPHDVAYTVTQNMKNAQAEIAYRISQGLDMGEDYRDVQSETVTSDLNISYFKSPVVSASPMALLSRMPTAKLLLDGLLCPGVKYLLRA